MAKRRASNPMIEKTIEHDEHGRITSVLERTLSPYEANAVLYAQEVSNAIRLSGIRGGPAVVEVNASTLPRSLCGACLVEMIAKRLQADTTLWGDDRLTKIELSLPGSVIHAPESPTHNGPVCLRSAQ